MRIKLIANPVSGGDARPRIQAAMEFLQGHGADVDLCLTGARGDARQAAAEALSEGYDRIVAAGGDGRRRLGDNPSCVLKSVSCNVRPCSSQVCFGCSYNMFFAKHKVLDGDVAEVGDICKENVQSRGLTYFAFPLPPSRLFGFTSPSSLCCVLRRTILDSGIVFCLVMLIFR